MDDTKIYNTPDTKSEVSQLQYDINNAVTWSQVWQLPFNSDKCKIMHIGKSNPNVRYNIINQYGNQSDLDTVTEEKDLGVLFDPNLRFNKHIEGIIKKANQMLGLVKRTFETVDHKAFIILYKSLVRSQLEYANVIWRPYRRGDIDKLEKVQRRATKCLKDLAHLPYQERLETLKLPTLEYRRKRGDMIQTYKIMHDLEDLDKDTLFTLSKEKRTRGHSLKLVLPRTNLDLRKYNFSVRVVKDWNGLPEEIVTAPSINCFKNMLDNFWSNQHYLP